jgi:phosphohistidine phosphatase
MRLFLIRHAKAKERSEELADEERPLTKSGREQFRRVVRRLDRAGVRFDRVYHSPLLRAVETADLLESVIDGETIVTPRLAEPARAEFLASIEGECVALVGHEPWLSDLLFWLVTGWQLREHRGHAAPFQFAKGGVAVLHGERRPGAMTLVALLPPNLKRSRLD